MPILSSTPARTTEPPVGCLGVRVRQPRVQREERHLDGEGQPEEQEEPHLRVLRHAELDQLVPVGGEADASGLARGEAQPEDADEHQERPDEGVDHELDRRVLPVLAAPDADDEHHRDERQLEEDVEEEEVERGEDAEHAGFQQQDQRVVALVRLPDVRPRREDDDGPQQRREQQEQHVQPVHADVVVDIHARQPAHELAELRRRRSRDGRVEAEPEAEGENEGQRRDPERDPPDGVRARHEHHRQRAERGQEDDQRDEVRDLGEEVHSERCRDATAWRLYWPPEAADQ